MKLVISIGLLLLLLPVLLLSLLLIAIRTSTSLSPPLPITPQKDSFISDSKRPTEVSLGGGGSSRGSYGTVLEAKSGNERHTQKAIPSNFVNDDSKSPTPGRTGGNNGPQNSPDSSPFDLTKTHFSPHWSAGKSTHCVRSPSPLDLSLTKLGSPTHWPSLDASGVVAPTEANESFSPIRIEVAVKRAIDNPITSSNFSTTLPDALRNVNEELEAASKALDNSFSSADDDSLELIVPKLDIRTMSDTRRQTLIARFKKVIAELEGAMGKQGETDGPTTYVKERLVGAPTPPPRPSAIPRNRIVGGENARRRLRDLNGSDWNLVPKLTFPSPPDSSPTRDTERLSPAVDGLYGAENVDHDYWNGFDQAYGAAEKSFESITSNEDLRTMQWKYSMGKWAEKGVNIMKPLDEESVGSNSSFKLSPASKKEVRFAETTEPILHEPTSPAAEIIQPQNTPIASPEKYPSSPVLVNVLSTENVIPGHENESCTSTEKLKIGSEVELSAPAPETPARQVLSKISNRDMRPNSPVLSPSGSVSGKLIKLFEELSKAEARISSRSLDSSPTHSVRVDTKAINNMMHGANMTMDGLDETTDVDTKEVLKRQIDGANSGDGLDECF
ncbi:hypothetical protein K440DRAFT_671502 [Wilcoxina mikolae CBS 423.85]|nr:hypothetical protein K440DRAFT_671502 [Wilcoxina mikolae CBS 423.85]